MPKTQRKRPQNPKNQNKGKDPNRMALSLRNGDGPHRPKTAYVRKAKHGGWSE